MLENKRNVSKWKIVKKKKKELKREGERERRNQQYKRAKGK